MKDFQRASAVAAAKLPERAQFAILSKGRFVKFWFSFRPAYLFSLRILSARLRQSDARPRPGLRKHRVDAASAFFETVTKFGDSGFLLPASVCLCVGLFAAGARHNAVAFAYAWAACIGATTLAKILLMACGRDWISASIHSPSGHASLSAMFFLTLGFISRGEQNHVRGRGFAVLCIVLVGLIAVSRVFLGAHTAAETLVGVVIGLTSFGAFWRYSGPAAPIPARVLLFGLAPLVLAYAASGAHLHLEGPLERIAAWLARYLNC
jgi:membrane-associated phospholipid phosphatase